MNFFKIKTVSLMLMMGCGKSTSIVDVKVGEIEKPVISPPVTSESSKFFINTESQAHEWVKANGSARPNDASLMKKITDNPTATWFGDWNTNVESDTRKLTEKAKAQNEVPILVAYAIPQRDCGGYSAGGTNSPLAYRTWMSSFARGIGNNKALVVLEPDALSSIDCLSNIDKEVRFNLISEFVGVLKSLGQVTVYIDGGHAEWQSADTMANRLTKSGVKNARGFSLNVSNFVITSKNIEYGEKISRLLSQNGSGEKFFIIDTSRNGRGTLTIPGVKEPWCNPSGRALGEKPTSITNNRLADAFLWIKVPGESDGQCGRNEPAAGTFWAEYALGLAERAAW